MENVHEELEKYECNKCGKCFTQNIGLKTHISAVHEKKIHCDLCGKHFDRGCDFKVHIQIVHEKDLEFKCDECDKNFTKAFNVKRHINNCSCKEMKSNFAYFMFHQKNLIITKI